MKSEDEVCPVGIQVSEEQHVVAQKVNNNNNRTQRLDSTIKNKKSVFLYFISNI